MKKYVEFSDEALECLLTGKAVEGTMKMDLMTRLVNFNMFNRKSREQGYVRPKDLTLHETTSGWLKKSAITARFGTSATAMFSALQTAERTSCHTIVINTKALL